MKARAARDFDDAVEGERSALTNAALLALEEINQDELRQVAGRGEVGFTLSHRRHLLDELDEVVVRGEHEGVNHDARLAARLNLAQRRLHHDGVAAHRVLVEPAAPVKLAVAPRGGGARARDLLLRVEEAGGRLAVRHHHDLLHLLALRLKDSARELQTFRGVRVVRADLRRRQLREWQLFRVVVEEDDLERVARILRADQVRERERDLLGGREAVFAVEDHRVRAVEHDDRGARRLIILLVDVQVSVFEVERDGQALALDGREQSRVHVEVDRVAELVRLRRLRGLDARREVRRVVATDGAFAEAAKQIAKRLVSEEVQALLRHLELHVARRRLPDLALTGLALPATLVRFGLLLAQLQVAFLDQPLDQLIQQLFQLRAAEQAEANERRR